MALVSAGCTTVAVVGIILSIMMAVPAALPVPAWGGVIAVCAAIVTRGTSRLASRLLGHFFLCESRAKLSDESLVRGSIELGLIFVVGTVVIWVAMALPETRWSLLTIPFLVTLFPAVQQLIKPWLVVMTMHTAGGSDAACESKLRQLQSLADDLAMTAGIRPARLAMIRGDLTNAFAIGLGISTWIIVGQGLLRHLQCSEVKALVAHEVAHLACGHARKFFLVSSVNATGFVLVLSGVFHLWDLGQAIPGALLAMLGGMVFMGAVPGWVRRRQEYEADQLSAVLVRDRALVVRALDSLTQAAGIDPKRESLFYPSIASRKEALAEPIA